MLPAASHREPIRSAIHPNNGCAREERCIEALHQLDILAVPENHHMGRQFAVFIVEPPGQGWVFGDQHSEQIADGDPFFNGNI